MISDNGFWQRLRKVIEERREDAIEGILNGLEPKHYWMLVGEVKGLDDILAWAKEVIGQINKEEGLER